MRILPSTAVILSLVCAAWPGSAFAQVIIDRRVTSQPIRVANDDGSDLSNPGMVFNESAVDLIWSQAGIDVEFLPATQYNSSLYNDVVSGPTTANNYYVKLIALSGQQHADPLVVNLYFVDTINSGGAYGWALIGQNGMVVSDQGVNRLDTISHELGHNLGLDHGDLGAGGALNLMTGSVSPPSSLDDIYPNGQDKSQLTSQQISAARFSNFAAEIDPFTYTVVPEPASTAAAVGAGLLCFAWYRRNR